MRRLLVSLNLLAGTAMTVLFAKDEIKHRLNRLAEVDKAFSAPKYVAIRFARGDYNNVNGIDQMINDYKFFGIITTDHNNPLD